MKKALVFVLILGFIGTLAFGQSAGKLTWNGYVNFGALLKNQGGTTTLASYGTDSWTPGRIRVTGTYSADTYGMSFRLENDGPWSPVTGGNNKLNQVWGWVKLLNGMLQVNAGELADYTWSTNQWESFGNFDGVTGIQFQIMPTKGVNFGVFVPTYSSGTGTLTFGSSTKAPLVFGGSYTSDMVYAAAGYDIPNSTAWFGLNYTGMKDLTAYVESKDVFTSTSANNYYYFDEYLAYALGNASVGSYLEEFIPASSGSNFIFHASPQLSYTMNNVTLGLRADFATDSVNTAYGAGAYAKLAVSSNAWIQAGAGYDAGTAAPTDPQQTVYDPLYGPQGGGTAATTNLTPQSNGMMRAFLDVGTTF